MYKYFDFKKIFEDDGSMMPPEPSTTVSAPEKFYVNLKEINKTSKLHILLKGTDVNILKTQGSLTTTAEFKKIDNETMINPVQISLYNTDSDKRAPDVTDDVLILNISNQIIKTVLDGIAGGNTIEHKISTSNKQLDGELINVVFTREIDVTNVKSGEIVSPIADTDILPAEAEAMVTMPESVGRLLKFNDFVNESKKKEKMLLDTKVKSIPVKKKKLEADEIAKELKKLEGKLVKKEKIKKK
jgi:hypothetical protein